MPLGQEDLCWRCSRRTSRAAEVGTGAGMPLGQIYNVCGKLGSLGNRFLSSVLCRWQLRGWLEQQWRQFATASGQQIKLDQVHECFMRYMINDHSPQVPNLDNHILRGALSDPAKCAAIFKPLPQRWYVQQSHELIAFPDVVDSRHPNEFVQKFGSKLDQLNSDVISTTCQQLFHKMVSTHLQGPNFD